MATTYTNYLTTNTILEGLVIPVISGVWLVSFCKVRQRGDPARRPFYWLKVASPLLAICFLLHVLGNAILLVRDKMIDDDADLDFIQMIRLAKAATNLYNVKSLFERLGHLALILCLVELGVSFLFLANGPHMGHTIMRWAAVGLCVVLFALSFTVFGITTHFNEAYYNARMSADYWKPNDEIPWSDQDNARKLNITFRCIHFAAAVAILTLASFVMVKQSVKTPLRKAAIYFLAGSILYFINQLWSIVATALWMVPKANWTPMSSYIIDAFLDGWTLAAVVVVVFIIGRYKVGGLWCAEQPWSMVGSPTGAGVIDSEAPARQAHAHNVGHNSLHV